MASSAEQSTSGKNTWRYILNGSVLPPGGYLHIEQPISGEILHEEAGLQGEWKLQINFSQISMTFESVNKVDDFYTLRNILYGVASECCDAVNLAHGTTLEVNLASIHAVQERENHFFRLGVSDVSLHEITPVTTTSDGNLSNHLVVSATDPSFARALADFRSALKYLSQSGFHCRRAFEALAHSFGPMGEDSKERRRSIEALQSALNLDDSCGRELLKASGSVRHGGTPWVTGESRTRWLKLTQAIIFRHAEYVLATKVFKKSPPQFERLKVEG